MNAAIATLAESLALTLNGRHLGEGVIALDVEVVNLPPDAEVASGEVEALVTPAGVTVAILWRDEDGDIYDGKDVEEDIDPKDIDSIRAAIARATLGA